ncbi:MAG: hypothetical protein JWO35_110 [Candidatus Saccharibacteria bacterium]|nr:hypothetical protein [Candidatus Saccharibacteria bacterium]
MQYILTTGWEDGIADLTQRLVRELTTGRNVLWLVSGGSNIKASVKIMDNIPSDLSRQLSVMLADERYGDVGHADSNWAQLLEAGFDPQHAQLLPVLQKNLTLEETAQSYNKLAGWAIADADSIIAQLGIGEDGHIAGILPGSGAAAEQIELVVGYHSESYDRLTLTLPALKSVNAIYAFAFGDTKHQALITLQSKKLDPAVQPAQILKHVPEAYLYNDQIGDPT